MQTGLGELDFVCAVDVDHVLQVHHLILGLFVDGDIPLLDPASQGLDDVALLINKDGSVIPAGEGLVGASVPDRFAPSDHPAGPTRAVREYEVSRQRIWNLFAGREGLNRAGMERTPGARCEHSCLQECVHLYRLRALVKFDARKPTWMANSSKQVPAFA